MNTSREVIYRVNSFRVPCEGVAPMSCLQVKRGDRDSGDWQNFYSQIDGFRYEPGYLYRLLVRETALPPEEVPADASSIRFELVELLDKAPDPRLAIHDTWVVERLDGVRLADDESASGHEAPYVEFNVVRGEYLLSSGCDALRGEIVRVGADELRLGPASVTGTSGRCDDGEFEQRMTAALGRVALWRRQSLRLELLDIGHVEVMALRKVD